MNIKKLLEIREDLCFRMLEADKNAIRKLEKRVFKIEQDLENYTGKRIEDLERKYYQGLRK